MNSQPSVRPHEKFLFLAIALAVMVYWAYLSLVTQPLIIQDAKSYEDLGAMIHDCGLKEYIVTGPNREPVYPLLVSLAMFLSDKNFYPGLLIVFQVLLFSVTWGLVSLVFLRCRVAVGIAFPALLYLGLSPAMTNTILTVYSEIAAFAFIVGIILVLSEVWEQLKFYSKTKSFLTGTALGLLLTALTLTKSIYEIISPLLLVPFLAVAINASRKKAGSVFKNTVFFLLSAITVFGGLINGYKALNLKYNGHYVLTDRAALALYGAAARRQMPLTPVKFGASLAYNFLEEDVCRKFFGAGECALWRVQTADELASRKNYDVIAHVPPDQRNSELLKAAFGKIFENPFQYLLLTGVDWLHEFFWESTRIGFVVYPDWLDGVYDRAAFAGSLRMLVGLLSLGAFGYALATVWRNRRYIRQSDLEQGRSLMTLFFCVYLVFLHVTFYSLFFTVPRFSLPIAPVFVMMIALCADRILRNFQKRI